MDMNISKKEISAIRRATFDAAMELPAVQRAFSQSSGAQQVYIFRLEETPGNRHIWIAVPYRTQINRETLKNAGFDPEMTVATLALTVDRSTRQAF